MPAGGRRPGAGRPKGAVCKKTAARLKVAEEAAVLGAYDAYVPLHGVPR
jgi:hypothetical protein